MTTTVNLTTSSTPATTETATTTATAITTATSTEPETTTTTATTAIAYVYDPIDVPAYVLEEERLAFKFFWEVANGDPESPGYGMISDRYNYETRAFGAASTASIGYGLSALLAGVENGWISRSEAYQRAYGTLVTIQGLERTHGFYYHFLNMDTGMRSGTSEVSIIDTAILMCGILTVGEYFGGAMQTLAETIYQGVEWDWYYDASRLMFYMGYQPGSGFSGHWDMYAEQLMIYLLAAGSTDHSVGGGAYYYMKSRTSVRSYGTSDPFYTAYAGTLFTYQFSHAWFDFREVVDRDGTDWFDNSVQASIAAYDYGQAVSQSYKTFSTVSWGLTASDGPDGYRGNYGNLPSLGGNYIDGTLAPCGAIGSIAFVPDLVIPTMEYYAGLEPLQGKYGFRDAFNLGVTDDALASVIRPNRIIPIGGWYNSDVIGIDKGITVLMIENYRSELIWYYFMQSDIVQRGFSVLEFTELN